MATITKTRNQEKLDEILSRPFILILHNDDVSTFDHVINCLIKYCKHEYEQASQCALLVHYTGKCDVKRGDQEIIKKMYNQLKGAGLSVTMELA